MNILLVEDNESVRVSIAEFLIECGHQVILSQDGEEALTKLMEQTVHLVLSDIRMPRLDGHQLLKKIRNVESLSATQVILFTGHGDIRGAVEAMRNGAYDYLLKPININELSLILDRLTEYLALKDEHKKLSEKFNDELQAATEDIRSELIAVRKAFAKSVGLSEIGIFSSAMQQVFELAEKLHHNPDIPVLIEGETGTGKELVAHYIHYGRGENILPFVALNCAAFSSQLFESELFGYEAGAFTGGNPKGQKGKIELAGNGTLFLDEISEMSPEHQAKLLRVLQEREFYRVGGLKKIATAARFIFATNKNIEQMVNQKEFRKDLYYRLNVGYVKIPALRERPDEIEPLASLMLKQLGQKKKTQFQEISPEVCHIFRQYSWPGNVRELKNMLERIVLHWDEVTIEPKHLDFSFFKDDDYKKQDQRPLTEAQSIKQIELPIEGIDLNNFTLDIVERALEKHDGNKTKTAQYLGISVRVLHTYLKRLEDR